MGIEISGINNLINKLSRISNLEAEKIVEEVSIDMEEAIVNKAKSFSNEGYEQYIGKIGVRKYKNSCYIDIGLSANHDNFELWKNLWFHEFGYHDKGLNFGENGPFISMHQMWFEEAIKEVEKDIKKKIKAKLKEEIQKEWER